MKQFDFIAAGRGRIALLVDPEKTTDHVLFRGLIAQAVAAEIDFFFVGGSRVSRKGIEQIVHEIKLHCSIPVILFPGAGHQLSAEADALLFLNLISGRNPDFLIGHHVQCAEEVLSSGIEVIPTGYILIDGGKATSVAYISQTTPIPRESTSIARQTAIAGYLMGQKTVYFDAGSGAVHPVPAGLIAEIKATLPDMPVIVGGGIRDLAAIEAAGSAGANVIVIGNKIEEDTDFLLDIRAFIRNRNASATSPSF